MSTITLNPVGTFASGAFDQGAAEIVAHDPGSQRLFVVNGGENTIDVLDVSNPADPQRVFQFDLAGALGVGSPNSVAVRKGIVAVAYEAETVTGSGLVGFLDVDGNLLNSVPVGALPDMLTFTPDGTKVLVANEGEPDGAVDPEGSVSIIDLGQGIEKATVETADFTRFDGREDELRAEGIRIFPGKSVSEDVEPEYIAVAGGKAYVALQEANAVAVVDIDAATVDGIFALGVKDHSRGAPTLEQFPFGDLPELGTTPAGQTIKLGGFSGLWFEGTTDDGKLRFLTVPDRGPNGEPTDTNGDGNNERPFALRDYQARTVPFTLDPASGEISIDEAAITLLTRADGTSISGRPNIAGLDEVPVDLDGNLLDLDPLGADLEGIVRTADGTLWMVDEYRPAIYHFAADGTLIDRFVPEDLMRRRSLRPIRSEGPDNLVLWEITSWKLRPCRQCPWPVAKPQQFSWRLS